MNSTGGFVEYEKRILPTSGQTSFAYLLSVRRLAM